MLPLHYRNQYYDTLCRNIATGCTFVMDRHCKDLATKHYPEKIYLHDYWLAIIANYCRDAHLVCDLDPSHILYRQHGHNQIGQKKSFIKRLFRLVFTKLPKEKRTSHLMSQFYALYRDDIAPADQVIFANIQNLASKKSSKFLRKHVKSNFEKSFRLKLFLRKY